ncbi:MAG: zinc-ribbon domain-containing protein [Fimbriimonadales bacterium]
MTAPTIDCHKCGTENPEARTYCKKCGALLVPDAPRPAWVRFVIAAILIIISAPVGLCGAAVTIAAVSELMSGPPQSIVPGFLPISLVSAFIGGGGLFLAYRTLWPR